MVERGPAPATKCLIQHPVKIFPLVREPLFNLFQIELRRAEAFFRCLPDFGQELGGGQEHRGADQAIPQLGPDPLQFSVEQVPQVQDSQGRWRRPEPTSRSMLSRAPSLTRWSASRFWISRRIPLVLSTVCSRAYWNSFSRKSPHTRLRSSRGRLPNRSNNS